MKLRLWMLTIGAAMLFSLPAFALDLHQARANGLVGEKLDGYVAAMQSTPEVNDLVASVNSQRRAEYGQISQSKGQPTDVVGKLAAQQIIGGLDHGSFYQAADGSWKQR
jgi:uncharacterized protein YdbL (DUF1318 family)